jgi:hypothetical protein
LQLDGDVSTHAYTVNDPSKQIDDWGGNTCNVADTVAPATCATGIAGQTDLAHSIFKVSRNAAGTTESVDPNPLTVGSGKPFDAANFQRDFQSGASCTLNSTSATHCTGDDSTYATGSKDTLGIGNAGWQCNHDNNVNDKVDINNAYVASFWTGGSAGNGDHILYAGIEKQKNNGTNDIGVWFLQGTASCSSQSAANFTGGHRNGDVLLVSEFSNGGGVSSVKTFTWRASTDPTSPFFGDGGCIDSRAGFFNPNSKPSAGCNGLPSGGGGDCKSASVNDTTCATTNAQFRVDPVTGKTLPAAPYAGTVSTPWLASDATLGIGNNQVVAPDYIEMGIDITKLFAATGETAPSCFNTGVPDTRSAPSITATLFDFVANQIGECHTDVKTTPVDATDHTKSPASSIPAAPANADVTVQDKATIGVTGISSFSGSIAWHICGRTDPSSSQLCDGSTGNVGVDLGSTAANANGDVFSPVVHITAAGRYCFRAEFSSTTTGVPPGSDSSSNECFTVAPQTPTLTTNATTAVETGTALNDVAHLGNTAKEPGTGGPANASPAGSINPTTLGGAAQGSITFTLYSAGTGNHCATAIGSSTVAVNGNGDYNANSPAATNVTGTFSPGPGTYYWKASYTGDLPNTTAKGTACDDANESSTVVDARISIAPNGVNEVNSNHTFTVTVTKNDGSGFVAASGASVTVTLTNAGGATAVPAGSLTGTTDSNGQFKVTFTSASAGTVTGGASASLTVDGVSLSRSTNGSSGNSGTVVKRFVDANISVSPLTAVNEVNHEHVFTITTNAFPAGTAATLTSITPSLSPTPDLENVSTCATPTVNGNTASCTVTIKSSTPGVFTLNATSVWHFVDSDTGANPGSVNVTRDTDPATANIGSGPSGSGPATKRFVDLKISIGPPEASNTVGDPHTFTVTVQQDDGLPANTGGGDAATGFGPVPDGTGVTVTLVNSGGANYEIPIGGDHCVQPSGGGTVNGVCGVTFTSQTAGTVTGNASVSLSVGGVPLTRDTDSSTAAIPCGGGVASCGPAIKHFVAGSISWTKVDNANPPRLLGGATFSLCRTAIYDFTTKSFSSIAPDCSFGPVVDNTGQQGYTGKDNNPGAGQFQVLGLPLGTYSVQETAAPPGYVPDPTAQSVSLSPNDPGPPPVNHTDQTVQFPFVNSRPVLKITGLSYTNAPDASVDQPDGIFVGNTTFTVQLHNYGTAAAVLADSSLVVSNGAGGTGLTCVNAGLLQISQTIAAGASNSPALTLSCHYDHPNSKTITGTLVVKYYTNVVGDTLERTASGSPATISFTVNPN